MPDELDDRIRSILERLQEELSEATQYAVFEPNDEPLWSNVRRDAQRILRAHWLAGELVGNKAEEAYLVRCDRTTMTQEDIANGRLIFEVGVAVLRPAEFVVFRILQNAGG